ncbi:unnamed protein product [Urochloa decumbens]|uniref:BTB domain-containing protein n=1 Tax=Urochloa decumbens TaxID=240449 RepID=A0ABC9BQA7_9POAL
MLNSGFVEFKLDHSQAKDLAVGAAVHSGNFAAGGHVWRIKCYPRGRATDMDDAGEYLSLYLELVTHATTVTADAPEPVRPRVPAHLAAAAGDSDARRGVTFVCGVIVLPSAGAGRMLAASPASDVASSLGRMLDSGDGSDVAFSVGGETFRAHRAVLAARSPVFRAELLGSMAEATMPTITLHDMEPETFKAMLRFMYTDTLPVPAAKDRLDGGGGGGCSSPADFLRGLLAAADRYAVDMLKLVCAQKLFDMVSVENVAVTLGCAEVHGCPELKSRCLDFFVEDERNFKKVVLTQGYLEMIQSLPSLVDDISARRGSGQARFTGGEGGEVFL